MVAPAAGPPHGLSMAAGLVPQPASRYIRGPMTLTVTITRPRCRRHTISARA